MRLTRVSLPLTLIAAMAAGAAAAQAPNAEVVVVSAPVWTKTPKGDDFARVYPVVARQQGLAGGATMTCRIDADGLLRTCAVTNEAPANAGFGQAALALASAYRMTERDETGLVTSGHQVAIPIRFFAPIQTGTRLKSVGF